MCRAGWSWALVFVLQFGSLSILLSMDGVELEKREDRVLILRYLLCYYHRYMLCHYNIAVKCDVIVKMLGRYAERHIKLWGYAPLMLR